MSSRAQQRAARRRNSKQEPRFVFERSESARMFGDDVNNASFRSSGGTGNTSGSDQPKVQLGDGSLRSSGGGMLNASGTSRTSDPTAKQQLLGESLRSRSSGRLVGGNNNNMDDRSDRNGKRRNGNNGNNNQLLLRGSLKKSSLRGGGKLRPSFRNNQSDRSGRSRLSGNNTNNQSDRSGNLRLSDNSNRSGISRKRNDHSGSSGEIGKRRSEDTNDSGRWRLSSNSVRSGALLAAGQDTAQSISDTNNNNRAGPFRNASRNTFGDDDDDDDDDDDGGPLSPQDIEQWHEASIEASIGTGGNSIDNYSLDSMPSFNSLGEKIQTTRHRPNKGGNEEVHFERLPTNGSSATTTAGNTSSRDRHNTMVSSSAAYTTTPDESDDTQLHDNTNSKAQTQNYNMSRAAAKRTQSMDMMSNNGNGCGGSESYNGGRGGGSVTKYLSNGGGYSRHRSVGNIGTNGPPRNPLFESPGDDNELNIPTFKPRSSFVEDYATTKNDFEYAKVTDEHNKGGSDFPSIRSLLNAEKNCGKENRGANRRNKKGLCECCDAMLGDKKTKRRKVSILILLIVLMLCAAGVVIYLTAKLAKPNDNDNEASSVKDNKEMGNSAPSPNSSPTRPYSAPTAPTKPLTPIVAVGNATNTTAGGTNATTVGGVSHNFTLAVPSSSKPSSSPPSASPMPPIMNPTIPSPITNPTISYPTSNSAMPSPITSPTVPSPITNPTISSASPMTQIVTPTFNGDTNTTATSSQIETSSPLTSCWILGDGTGGQDEGYSMPVANLDGDDQHRDYVCISFCFDCSTYSGLWDIIQITCTNEQRAEGIKISRNMAIPNGTLEYYETTYADEGFTSCETDDCNKMDACEMMRLNSGVPSRGPTIKPTNRNSNTNMPYVSPSSSPIASAAPTFDMNNNMLTETSPWNVMLAPTMPPSSGDPVVPPSILPSPSPETTSTGPWLVLNPDDNTTNSSSLVPSSSLPISSPSSSLMPSPSPSSGMLTSSSMPTDKMSESHWWLKNNGGTSECVYGEDYPELFLTNEALRETFIFDSEEECCTAYSGVCNPTTFMPSSLPSGLNTMDETSKSSLIPLTKCWVSDPSSGQEGYSIPVPDDQDNVCISYCLDCATSSLYDPTCTNEQRLDGTKLSMHLTIPRDDLDVTAMAYADSGFTPCETDDCNKADACTASSNNSDMNSFVSASLDTLSAPYAMSFIMESPSMLSRYGSSVAISGDGNLIAVGASEATSELTGEATGAVYLYSLDTNFGIPSTNSLSLLQVLYGQSSSDEFGNAIALSQDGNRIIVGSRSENRQTGAMRIYQLDDGVAASSVNGPRASGNNSSTLSPLKSWSLSDVILGKNQSERAGWAVSISADGNVIAMGSPKGGTEEGGSILAFKYNDISSGWDPYGSLVQGLPSREDAGYSVSLSDTGATMVVGFPRAVNLDGASNAGKVALYFMSGSGWQLLGQEVYGEAAGDIDGTSVAMSQDGSVLVIGGKGRSEVDATTGEVILKSTGHCRVYQFQSSEWEFQYSIEGKDFEERLGSSVAVSPDGNIVACGGVNGVNGNSKKSGVVRLWNRVTLQESTIWPRERGNDVEGATFGTSLAISADGEYVIVGAPTWSGANDGGVFAGAIQIFRDVS